MFLLILPFLIISSAAHCMQFDEQSCAVFKTFTQCGIDHAQKLINEQKMGSNNSFYCAYLEFIQMLDGTIEVSDEIKLQSGGVYDVVSAQEYVKSKLSAPTLTKEELKALKADMLQISLDMFKAKTSRITWLAKKDQADILLREFLLANKDVTGTEEKNIYIANLYTSLHINQTILDLARFHLKK